MSKKHLRYSYRDTASSYHKLLGTALRTHPLLRGYRSLQEYPIPGTPYHIDWWIVDLKIAIEVHGEQHHEPVQFGGITKEEAGLKLEEQVKRDQKKKRLCQALGWKYVEFWYHEPLDGNYVADKILKAL